MRQKIASLAMIVHFTYIKINVFHESLAYLFMFAEKLLQLLSTDILEIY